MRSKYVLFEVYIALQINLFLRIIPCGINWFIRMFDFHFVHESAWKRYYRVCIEWRREGRSSDSGPSLSNYRSSLPILGDWSLWNTSYILSLHHLLCMRTEKRKMEIKLFLSDKCENDEKVHAGTLPERINTLDLIRGLICGLGITEEFPAISRRSDRAR